MTTEAIVEQLQPWRERWKRSAWRPITEVRDGAPTASKFGGTPWLAVDEAWPRCQRCQALMPLFLQLNLAQLPTPLATIFGTGLLQLFYCTQYDDDAYLPFSPSSLVRIVQPAGQTTATVVPLAAQTFTAQTIVAWAVLDDYPHPEEHEALGVHYNYDGVATRVDCPALGLVFEHDDEELAEKISNAASGDKLAGWPYWVQRVEYPVCPQCHTQMRFVFQLDSEDHLPFMFGDLGTGHITQCPTHTASVAFGWACS